MLTRQAVLPRAPPSAQREPLSLGKWEQEIQSPDVCTTEVQWCTPDISHERGCGTASKTGDDDNGSSGSLGLKGWGMDF